jgi:hypothetical protein
MELVGDVDLKMEMVSVGISRISNFSQSLSELNNISFVDQTTRKVSVTGIYIGFVRKCMFDSNKISPTTGKFRFYNFTISKSENGCTDGSGNIYSEMTPESHIPAIVIGCSPEYGVNPAILRIIFVFFIVGVHNPRKCHFTGVI